LVEPASVYNHNWHIDAISEHLEAAYRGEIKKLLINIPPGCMKSLLTCVFGPAYAWTQQPGLAWIFASFDAKLTARDAEKTLRLLQSDWFKSRWGNVVSVSDEAAITEYVTLQGGFRFATSVAGKATGRHPDIVVVDDPIKPKEVTKITLEATINWWRSTMLSRARDPMTVRRICIMQRLHQRDLAGVFIEEGGWEHLCIPMRFEPHAKCVTSLWEDPRTEDGELMWPSRHRDPELRANEIEMTPAVVAAQNQQRPAPEGGLVFLREWFQTYSRAETPKFDAMCQSWDCAFKAIDSSDYVVGQVWGRKGGQFYLLDEVRARMTFSDTCAAIRAMRAKWPKVSAILIEDKANGPAVESVLCKEIPGIVMINPQGGKESRANAASPFFEAKNVFHPNPSAAADAWVEEHREELANFPTGTYDDRVDACTQALIWLAERRSAMIAAMETLRDRSNPFSR
jgi:predicted phage terminase large subunit-like protein